MPPVGAVTDNPSVADPVGSRHGSGRDLQLGLDYPLPSGIAVGAGNALFVCGWCFSPRARTRALTFVVDGEVQPVMFFGMARADVFRAFHSHDRDSADDAMPHSFRSGFW